jgi:hypothetical protein
VSDRWQCGESQPFCHGIIRGAIDDIRGSDRYLFDSNRYPPDRADELTKELTLLEAENRGSREHPS